MLNGSNGNGKGRDKLNLLYVEDDRMSQEILVRLLKGLGYPDLIVFEDSRNFLERVKALPSIPDIVFLDVQVGPLDGHQMLKMLRSDDTYKDTKIIAMTASVMSAEVKELRDAGFDGLVGKPIMKRVFPELLQRIVDGESVWYVS
ncbi:MAG: response regulator [Anaerolineae bacterium]|nr:response regulator [Anaerolineae bacterium]